MKKTDKSLEVVLKKLQTKIKLGPKALKDLKIGEINLHNLERVRVDLRTTVLTRSEDERHSHRIDLLLRKVNSLVLLDPLILTVSSSQLEDPNMTLKRFLR